MTPDGELTQARLPWQEGIELRKHIRHTPKQVISGMNTIKCRPGIIAQAIGAQHRFFPLTYGSQKCLWQTNFVLRESSGIWLADTSRTTVETFAEICLCAF